MTGDVKKWDSSFSWVVIYQSWQKTSPSLRSNLGIASEDSQVQEPELNKWSPKYGSAAQTSFRVLFEDNFTN